MLGLSAEGEDPPPDKETDRKVFKEVLLFVKSTAYEKLAEDAPLAEVVKYQKDIEQLKKLKL